MGYFTSIKLKNFRNLNQKSFEFSNNSNVFFGKNGSGKTNLLEAISLSVKGRGIRKDNIQNFIEKEKSFFSNTATFFDNDITYQIKTFSETVDNKIKKKILLNDDFSRESSLKIESLITFLVYLPENERLFLASPRTRRDFIDHFISTSNYSYNKLINFYKKNINERNLLLNDGIQDETWLSKIEENIAISGKKIYNFRNDQLICFRQNLEIIKQYLKLPYKLEIKTNDLYYQKKIEINEYQKLLKQNRHIDKLIGGSKIGPHKTDYIFYIDNNFLASQLSTGQQKTLVLLLYLSQCNYLVNNCNLKPILLLDEICSHLDELNRKILMNIVSEFDVQIFMTGTSKDLFSFLSTNTKFCNISNK